VTIYETMEITITHGSCDDAEKKTFRTYDEQIDFIKSRGIVVEDKNDAVEALSTYSIIHLSTSTSTSTEV